MYLSLLFRFASITIQRKYEQNEINFLKFRFASTTYSTIITFEKKKTN